MKKLINIVLVVLGIGALLYLLYRRRPDVAAPVASIPLLGGQVDITRSKTEIQNDIVARLRLPADTGPKKKPGTGTIKKIAQSKVFRTIVKPVTAAALNIVAPGAGTLVGRL